MAILSTLFCVWWCGVPAIIYAAAARILKSENPHHFAARIDSMTQISSVWSIISCVFGILLLVIMVVIYTSYYSISAPH